MLVLRILLTMVSVPALKIPPPKFAVFPLRVLLVMVVPSPAFGCHLRYWYDRF
jgi:hypothetical protein